MRTAPIFATLLVIAVGCSRDGGNGEATPALLASGPDPITIRVPLQGGTVRAFAYPALDSVVWRASQPIPPVERLLAFDFENGVLAFADTAGGAGWLDLRLGTVRSVSRRTYSNLASSDGWSIFGASSDTSFVRLTPAGDWHFSSHRRVRRLFPLADGTLMWVGQLGGALQLYRMRPPDETLVDSLSMERVDRGTPTQVGDRLYLAAGKSLIGVRPNSIDEPERFGADDDILALAPTPSGDRVFVASKGSQRLEVLDRYNEKLSGSVRLPGFVTELRMDPVGRLLLARPVESDSVWVIDVASERLVATLATSWRFDLPTVAQDGRLALLRGNDVVFTAARQEAKAVVMKGGGQDAWFFTRWNGFRPRARGIDQPVSFRLSDDSAPPTQIPATGAAVDSAPATPSTAAEPPPPDRPSAPLPAAAKTGWTVSFAAVLSQDRANEIASTITVNGVRPRIVPGETGGSRVYRVVLGPYPTRDEAERVGRQSQHSFWVFEGVP